MVLLEWENREIFGKERESCIHRLSIHLSIPEFAFNHSSRKLEFIRQGYQQKWRGICLLDRQKNYNYRPCLTIENNGNKMEISDNNDFFSEMKREKPFSVLKELENLQCENKVQRVRQVGASNDGVASFVSMGSNIEPRDNLDSNTYSKPKNNNNCNNNTLITLPSTSPSSSQLLPSPHPSDHPQLRLALLSSVISETKRPYLSDLIKPLDHFKLSSLMRNIFISALMPAKPIIEKYLDVMREELERYDRMDECEAIGIEFDEEDDPPIDFPKFHEEFEGYPVKVVSGLTRSLCVISICRSFEQLILYFTHDISPRIVDRLTKTLSKSAIRKINRHVSLTVKSRLASSIKLFKTSLYSRILPNMSIFTYDLLFAFSLGVCRVWQSKRSSSTQGEKPTEVNESDFKEGKNDTECRTGASKTESVDNGHTNKISNSDHENNDLKEIGRKLCDSAKMVLLTYISECILSCVGTFVWAGYGTEAGLALGSLAPALLPALF